MSKFRLQRVLEIKLMFEKQKEKALSAAQAKLLIQQGLLEQMHKQKEVFLTVMNEAPKDARDLSGRYQYLDTLMDAIANQKKVVAAAHNQVEAKRNELLQASKERKVLEKLKDKAEQESLRAAERTEQAFLDELARR